VPILEIIGGGCPKEHAKRVQYRLGSLWSRLFVWFHAIRSFWDNQSRVRRMERAVASGASGCNPNSGWNRDFGSNRKIKATDQAGKNIVFGVIFTNKLSHGSNRKIFKSTGKKQTLVCVVVFRVIFTNKLSHGYNPVDPGYKKSMLLTV
jgi:hypothetical protein